MCTYTPIYHIKCNHTKGHKPIQHCEWKLANPAKDCIPPKESNIAHIEDSWCDMCELIQAHGVPVKDKSKEFEEEVQNLMNMQWGDGAVQESGMEINSQEPGKNMILGDKPAKEGEIGLNSQEPEPSYDYVEELALSPPLPVPGHRWRDISVNFIQDPKHPKTSSQYTIMKVTDMLSKQERSIPCLKNTPVRELAGLFIQHVWTQHGLPATIVSNRGEEFVNKFWMYLRLRLGIYGGRKW